MADGIREKARLELTVERPVAGGAMLARHLGRVVLVTGAIPGERVRVRVDRERRDVVHATTEQVIESHPARRVVTGDAACGGQVYRHVEYPHQLTLKAEVVRDALSRIARLDWPERIHVAASKEHGYRMRARLRAESGRLGFFREGSHQVCDAAETGQLLVETGHAVTTLGQRLGTAGKGVVAHVDIAENVAADQRVVHFHLRRRVAEKTLAEWTDRLPVTGVTSSRAHVRELDTVMGVSTVGDPLAALLEGGPASESLVRHAPSFYQSNRYLLASLVGAVHRRVSGPVLDLYAGVGVFSVTLATRVGDTVVAVERSPSAVSDLRANAGVVAGGVQVESVAVEDYLAQRSHALTGTVIVDPPRAGLGRAVIERISVLGATRLVYVACDVATFARDLRRFADLGFAVEDIETFDMFPNTAHIEIVATLTR